MGAETVYLETLDGISIESDVVRTEQYPARAVVVIAHPHPEYGGDRFNHVVRALQDAAADLGCHSIAIDFRGVGNSGGIHDNGDAERLDLAAACELGDMIEPDCPIIMAGYSFGSVVGLNVSNPFIAAWLAVAPPLPFMTSVPTAANNHRPKFLLVPEHDKFHHQHNYVTPSTVGQTPRWSTYLASIISSWLMAHVRAAKSLRWRYSPSTNRQPTGRTRIPCADITSFASAMV